MQKFNPWPYAITISIIFIAFACIATIMVALKNPVEMDNFYLEKYQNVDEKMHIIKQRQEEFFKFFKVEVLHTNDKIALKIINLSNNSLNKNANISLLITRPDTNKFNQTFTLSYPYEVKNLKFEKLGRWQIKASIKIAEKIGFFEDEIAILN